nr:alpha/beta fold hydrolase [Pseudomonas nunensis]
MNKSPSAPTTPRIIQDEYTVEGIRVERYRLAELKHPTSLPPIVCVHGGGQASWCWEDFAPPLVAAGFEVHALNWLGRNGSASIEDDVFLKMSIVDVVSDIAKVAKQLAAPFILVGHSMGGLACQLYAQDNEVKALLLMTPVVPSQVNAAVVELPIDHSAPWGPVPFQQAKELFFQGLNEEQCRHFYQKLVPESPLRCFEATRWTLPVKIEQITMPTLIVSGQLDYLTPQPVGRRLAELFGAEYRVESDLGHNVLLGKRGAEVAASLVPWILSKI